MKTFKGVHYIDTLIDCKNQNLLIRDRFCKKEITKKIKSVGLNCVGYTSKDFDSGGFTAVWLLEESHISIHTWPELYVVDLDIYVCNYSKDNSERAREIYEFIRSIFKSNSSALKIVKR